MHGESSQALTVLRVYVPAYALRFHPHIFSFLTYIGRGLYNALAGEAAKVIDTLSHTIDQFLGFLRRGLPRLFRPNRRRQAWLRARCRLPLALLGASWRLACILNTPPGTAYNESNTLPKVISALLRSRHCRLTRPGAK